MTQHNSTGVPRVFTRADCDFLYRFVADEQRFYTRRVVCGFGSKLGELTAAVVVIESLFGNFEKICTVMVAVAAALKHLIGSRAS